MNGDAELQELRDEQFTMVIALRAMSHHNGAEFNNIQRFIDIGMITFEHYMTKEGKASLKEFLVIVPKSDVQLIQNVLTSAYPKWPWKVINEDTLLHPSIPPGWARQQTAKLAVSFLVQTDLYLIVDDDTYLTKPFQGAKDLREQGTGKVLMNRTQIDFPFFFLWSAQVLQCNFDTVQSAPFHMAITPEVFITSEVRELTNHLVSKYGDKKMWQVQIVNNKFTEYCMYWIWLIMKGKTEQLYANQKCPHQLYGYPTTGPEHDMEERVAKSFSDNAYHIFSFVQSSLPYPISKIKDAVLKHMQM